jgi:hypothetical protein
VEVSVRSRVLATSFIAAIALLACAAEPAPFGSGLGGGGDDDDQPPSDDVCERWNQDRQDLSEGAWSGSLETCDPGDVSADGRDNALRLLNLYRFLAGLPEVETDPTRDAKAQACGLIMHANNQLSHNPPDSWTCWSADGAEAAGNSNIATAPGVTAVDLYMVDPGNATTLGHRRWILSNGLGPVGLGSTSNASCMWVLGGSGGAGNDWTAFPTPGEFPFGAVGPSWTSIDETGWSVQSDAIDLSSAQVAITADGEDHPVTVVQLDPGYGSAQAIAIIPQGWTTQPDTIYHVEVTGVAAPIAYDVDVVDCAD